MFWFMDMKGICVLPVFLVIWSSSTFIVSYVIALFEHDVGFILPYISEIGAKPPESCIFGLMTVITAFAGMATMYARYKFVEKLNEKAGGVPPVLNQAALWIGTLSCLGMCFVATFQETTIIQVHDAGAILFFVSGVLYTILQSIISYKTFPYGCSMALCHVRTGMATMGFLAVPPTIIFALLHRTEDKDNVFHLVSAVSEWIVVFSFIFFFFTYIHDFKKFILKLRTEFVS
ncbi:DNA damage-regulated autophagy modulator protein 1-like isoform 1-T1 [Salvelinus alpinus]|uniref:DNA damage-regulated autophagy modulator protein 1 n=1 Tax=Salvelinus sp. IW2-2015 TaxID=2691554 RepID=UPI000CDFC3C1|nr:DNA damage-regulated autophagy modulator protein 1 isoform X1 [Salvelinus alpinus]